MKFIPNDYKKTLNLKFNLHALASAVTLISAVLSIYNDLFSSSLFSQTRESVLKENAKSNNNFYIITGVIYSALIFFYVITMHYFNQALQRIADEQLGEGPTRLKSGYLFSGYYKACQSYTKQLARLLEMGADEIPVHFHSLNSLYRHDPASASATLFGNEKLIRISPILLQAVKDQKASLGLVIAHEMVHLKRDSSLLSQSGITSFVLSLTKALLNYYQLPIQVAYFIAGSVVFGLKSAFAYSLGTTLLLVMLNDFSRSHFSRLRESRADFESLFCDKIRYSPEEYDKHINFLSNNNELEIITNTYFNKMLFLYATHHQTHPDRAERVEMINNSRNHYGCR